jgi:hypothetical protein
MISRLPGQALAREPGLDQLGDLDVVLVHHDHVRIAVDAGLGQIDGIDASEIGSSAQAAEIISTAAAAAVTRRDMDPPQGM